MVLRVLTAWILGWVVYMGVFLMYPFDGIIPLLANTFVGAPILSAVAVAIATQFGSVVRMPAVQRIWRVPPLFPLLVCVASLFILFFGSTLGFVHTYTDPELGDQVTELYPGALYPAYFCMIFTIVNWPGRVAR